MKSFANLSSLTIISAILIGCATPAVQTPAAPADPATRLAVMMAGNYLSADTGVPVSDRRVKIDPLETGQWLYHQIDNRAGLNPIFKQRVLSLRSQPDGRVIQTAYILITPDIDLAMGNTLSTLTREQLQPEMGEGCDMVWVEMPNGWKGQIDPSRCVITIPAQQGERRRGAREEFIDNRFRKAETGYDLDGNRLWGSEDGEWTSLYRTPS